MVRHLRCRSDGFTLIELLVVVGIIALLVAIMLPGLKKARDQAKSIVCAGRTKNMATAIATYLADMNGVYPASYLYPDNEHGRWAPETQTLEHPHGYLHWSWHLFEEGRVEAENFECPKWQNGGAPRTNPGPEQENWEDNQVDQNGDKNPNELEDKQAPRMAFAANAAVIPRNKFTPLLSGGDRTNIFVEDSWVTRPGDTVLLTEFLNNWKALGISQGEGTLVKSHRPINPFFHIGSGYNEYQADEQAPGFIYGLMEDQETYGILKLGKVIHKSNILDYTSGISQINAVGRHHPGGDKHYGGTANFVFCDGHAERMTPMESVQKKRWGDKYYSITGKNKVLNYDRPITP
jgi:prepilin-type N-terminal cleavage/methylation domain-containing protein/prepilin-type processing-associated H-X9-DG protein